jgi:phosphatidate phosphatase APP1
MRHLKLVSSAKYDLIRQIIDFVEHDASQKHKLTVIQNILDHAPKTQQFIMVGDSGELDPEVRMNKLKIIYIL